MANRITKAKRYFAVFMIINLLAEIISPTLALALSNGPVQQEQQGFTQASDSEVVDLFTGDFKYNIPLLDIDGYPLNISYRAGARMEDEASWVGLGWSMNPGVLTRMMRGLPDDFDGDQITSETNMADHFMIEAGQSFRFTHNGSYSYLHTTSGYGIGVSKGYTQDYSSFNRHSVALQTDFNYSYTQAQDFTYGTGVAKTWGEGWSSSLSTADGATFSFYKMNGISRPTLPNEWKSEGIKVKSESTSFGNQYNTNSGIRRNFGSRTTSYSAPVIAMLDPEIDQVGTSVTKSHVLPVSVVSFLPRNNNNFMSVSSGSGKLNGFYSCGGFWGFTAEDLWTVGSNYRSIKSKLVDKNKSLSSYGYMNLENADDVSLMDFNRFNDGVYMPEMKNGSFSTITNDMFVSTAQGMASNFRAFRSDYGIVHDPNQASVSKGGHMLTTNGFPNWYYKELGININAGISRDGNWGFSPVCKKVKFYKPDPTRTSDRAYEKYFFKELGEPTPVDQTYEGLGGGEGAAGPTLTKIGDDFVVNSFPGGGKRNTRVIRDKHISCLTAAEASERGINKSIKDYSVNLFNIDQNRRELSDFSLKSRINFNNLTNIDKHLSEFMVTSNDGTRYVYGIPAYNKLSRTVTFNASIKDVPTPLSIPSDNPSLHSRYLKRMEYTPTDASPANVKGFNNYFNKMEVPPYASAFLLTSIISPDYVDLTGDGPSHDDLGNYTQFNYSHTNEYEWRNPYNVKSSSPNIGNMNGGDKNAHEIEGYEADDFDDMATFEYGKRDNWYLHSIETKNYVAEFQISQRDDNCGVAGEDGILASGTSYRLDEIRLYTKQEKITAQISGQAPVPLKKVNFEYDYSLCNGVYNGNAGKLTLKKIYMTYGASGKMALVPYRFTYADNDHDGTAEANPNYDPMAINRWGTYKENDTTYNNHDYPYAEQEQGKANLYAASWNLTSLETPSGAKTDIYYEADDYAYVQDEPNGVMLRLVGFYSTINKTPSVDLSTVAPDNIIYSSTEALIDLEALNTGIKTSVSVSDANKLIQNRVLPKKKQLFMRCKTFLTGTGINSIFERDYWQDVNLYATIMNSGIISVSGTDNSYTNANGTFYKYAWIKLKPETVENEGAGPVPQNNVFLVQTPLPPQPAPNNAMINPVSRAGFEMVRSAFPRLAYPGGFPKASEVQSGVPKKVRKELKASLGSQWNDFQSGAKNYAAQNGRLMSKFYCHKVDYQKCFIRAYTPYKKKIGDGHRVKKIVTHDNWNNAGVGETNSDYGQEYSYVTKDVTETISSGVASYEPLFGGEENTMHQPVKFWLPRNYAPHDHYFHETPYLENLYATPMIGYSKVTVRNIDHSYTNGSVTDNVCQVGKTEFEFYTAKEFPTIERSGTLKKEHSDNEPIDEYSITPEMFSYDYITQGLSVKLNDMHGKIKSMKVYGEDNLSAPISGSTYYYKARVFKSNGAMELRQDVSTIDENLGISSRSIGREIDVTNDLRYTENFNFSLGLLFTKKYSLCTLFGKKSFFNISPGTIRMALGRASTTKVVHQYGILEKVETFDKKAKFTKENVLWDLKTGEVVLTKTINHLDQPVYSFNYPAYWVNSGMGHKYTRQGMNYLIDLTIPTPIWDMFGNIDPTTINNILHPGDEVFIYKAVSGAKVGDRFWITQNPVNPTKWNFQDINGTVLTFSHPDLAGLNQNLLVKVDRPVERNTQSLKAAQLTTLHNPLTNISGGTLPILNQKVIDATAVEYCEVWDYYRKTIPGAGQSGGVLPQTFDNTAMSSSGNPRINPYSSNLLGCWRPYKLYSYNDSRTYDAVQPNVKKDGFYGSYSPYYQRISGSWQTIPATDASYGNWVKMGENSMYTPYSELIEVKDARGIPSVQRNSFNHTLPVLSAFNSKGREVSFESFEEYGNGGLYDSYSPNQRIMNDYMGFYEQINSQNMPNVLKPSYTESQFHAGKASLDFSANQSATLVHYIDCIMDIEQPPLPPRCDYKGLIRLNRPKYHYQTKYWVSFWVKAKNSSSDYQGAFNFNVQIRIPNTSTTANAVLTLTKTNIINGWQKFDYVVDYPPFATNPDNEALFLFSVPANKPGFYLDDIRIQPFNATMKTTVYDGRTLRPSATFDENNFATFMEYDNSGMMVRTKKETLNGVFTLSETRISVKK